MGNLYLLLRLGSRAVSVLGKLGLDICPGCPGFLVTPLPGKKGQLGGGFSWRIVGIGNVQRVVSILTLFG